MIVRYVVPGAPVGQNRNGAKGTRAYGKTPEQKAFTTRLAAYGINARRRAGWETTTDKVTVGIVVWFDSERPDIDSPEKAILDSLEVSRPKLHRPGAAFLANDRQVSGKATARGVDPKNPRVEITITRADAKLAPAEFVARALGVA